MRTTSLTSHFQPEGTDAMKRILTLIFAAALVAGCQPLWDGLNAMSQQPCPESGVYTTIMGGSAGPGGALGDRVVCNDVAEAPWPNSSLKQPTADEQRALLTKHGIPLPH
jgi:hypothetical protein